MQNNFSKNQISVYPKLKNASTTTYSRLSYIYGTGVAWQGNNAGAGAFGHVQFIVCGIGLWGGALYGANINYFSSEYCGIGLTLGRAYETVMGYNVNAGYFETNTFDYIQQWGNGPYPLLKLGINRGLNVDRIVEMQSYRFGADDKRLQSKFDMSAITFKNREYRIKPRYTTNVDLSDPNDVLLVSSDGGDLQLYFDNEAFNFKFTIWSKTIVINNSWRVNGNNILLKAPTGWKINGADSITLYRRAEATVLTVAFLEGNYGLNKQLFVAGSSIYKPSGTTAERPTDVPVGYMYLDTTLVATGKPIYKTATGWVDGLGAVV